MTFERTQFSPEQPAGQGRWALGAQPGPWVSDHCYLGCTGQRGVPRGRILGEIGSRSVIFDDPALEVTQTRVRADTPPSVREVQGHTVRTC